MVCLRKREGNCTFFFIDLKTKVDTSFVLALVYISHHAPVSLTEVNFVDGAFVENVGKEMCEQL